jgi:hypothetical protein
MTERARATIKEELPVMVSYETQFPFVAAVDRCAHRFLRGEYRASGSAGAGFAARYH